MKFLADMGISPKTVDLLTTLGYNAKHLYSEGLERLSDSDILAKALVEERIVLTHDLDFGELWLRVGQNYPVLLPFVCVI